MSAFPISVASSGVGEDPPPLRIADTSLSPSLGGRGRTAAYEVKFLLSEKTALQIEAALKSQLQLDPYANPSVGDAYQITSTYLDTPRLEVFHRIGRHRFRKYRIRRYGDAAWSFLERKTKRKEQVRKARSKADLDQISWLAAPLVLQSWEGAWFHRQAARWSLAPTCQVSYLRRAFFGEAEGNPIRLTFDRGLRAQLVDGWSLTASSPEQAIGAEEVICEFKFRGAMPRCFREVVEDFGIMARGASKYRRSLETLGLATSQARSGQNA